jgi:hypothetical protein
VTDQRLLAQLMAALQELRAQAVHVRDGAYRARDLMAVQADLARRWSAAMEMHSEMMLPGTPGPMTAERLREPSGLSATIGSARLSAALTDISLQDYSVESIDAAIRIAVGLRQ